MLTTNLNSGPNRNVPASLVGLVVVSLSNGDHIYGLFRVKRAGDRSLLLHPGIYEFPVGSRLDVEDYQYAMPTRSSFQQRVTVVRSDRNGIHMVW